jgi:ERCC4-related helicase
MPEEEKDGIEKFMLNIKPRDYQQTIFETCSKKSCLVVLPTGTGKTLVALMLTIARLKEFPASKVLFLAPTRPLAEQHLAYFEKHLPELFATKTIFTGKVEAEKRRKLWQSADIVFSTPQCIGNDIKNDLYDLNEVSLLIEDECHRCLKNYAYTYIATKYKEQSKFQRVLGLTASPGAEKAKIQQIAKNLGIEAIEIRTRESEDVKKYLQELKYETIKLDFPDEFSEIRDLLSGMYNKKVEELKNRKLLFAPPMKRTILELQRKIMTMITTGNRNFNVLAGASACAQAIKLQYCLELLETQTLSATQRYVQDIFDQARQKKSKSVQQLIKQPAFNQSYVKLTELIARKVENPKLIVLRDLIEEEFKTSKVKRIIIFAQYRDTLVKICKTLNEVPGINARVFVGQAKKGKGEDATGLSQKEQAQLITDFTLGKVNVLCASSIGEEGLDIPEVSAVIFYEPIPSAIRQIQRRGRTARLKPGKLVVLMIKNTRDEAYYWAAFNREKSMYKAIDGIKADLDSGKLDLTKNNEQKTLSELK